MDFRQRPAIFGYLFLLILLAFLRKDRLNKADYRKIGILQILWVNLHGSFILLPILFFWRIIGQEQAHLKVRAKDFGFLLILLGLCMVNPYTYSVFPYVIKTARYAKMLHIQEWNFSKYDIFLAMGLQILVFLACSPKEIKKNTAAFLRSPYFILFALCFLGAKNTALYIFLLPTQFYLYRMMTRSKTSAATSSSSDLSLKLFIISLLTVFCIFFSRKNETNPWYKSLPVPFRDPFYGDAIFKIADRVKASNCQNPVFNNATLGSFLMMSVKNKIFLDNRSTPFTPKAIQEYTEYLQGRNLDNLLNRYAPCFAILDVAADAALISELLSKGFRKVLIERQYCLLEKSEKTAF